MANSGIYSFLSGAFISVSVNLYTGILSSDVAPARWKLVLVATVLTGLSSLAWALLFWRLDELQRIYANTKGSLANPMEAWELLIGHRRRRLLALFVAATLAALLGLLALPIGIQIPKVAGKGETLPSAEYGAIESTHPLVIPQPSR